MGRLEHKNGNNSLRGDSTPQRLHLNYSLHEDERINRLRNIVQKRLTSGIIVSKVGIRGAPQRRFLWLDNDTWSFRWGLVTDERQDTADTARQISYGELSSLSQKRTTVIPAEIEAEAVPQLEPATKHEKKRAFRRLNSKQIQMEWEKRRIALETVQELCAGAFTPSFIRAAKYPSEEALEERGVRALSLVSSGGSLDLVFDQSRDRDAVGWWLSQALELPLSHSPPRNPPPRSAQQQRYERAVALVHGWVYCPATERTVLAIILINVVVMALSSPIETNEKRLDVLRALELVCSLVFTVEALARIVALEGWRPYLADPWNRLDFFIVSLGWVFELPLAGGFNFTAFRAFRALRALRTMRFLQGVRLVLETFIGTMHMIVQALGCYLYFVVFFAVLGQQLFGTALDYRCTVVLPSADGSDPSYAVAQPERFCSPELEGRDCGGEERVCVLRVDARMPWSEQTFGFEGNPDYDYTGFSSFPKAFHLVQRVSARAGVAFSLHGTRETTSDFAVVYFVCCVVAVSHIVMALFVAIVRTSYADQEDKRELEANGGSREPPPKFDLQGYLEVPRDDGAQPGADAGDANLRSLAEPGGGDAGHGMGGEEIKEEIEEGRGQGVKEVATKVAAKGSVVIPSDAEMGAPGSSSGGSGIASAPVRAGQDGEDVEVKVSKRGKRGLLSRMLVALIRFSDPLTKSAPATAVTRAAAAVYNSQRVLLIFPPESSVVALAERIIAHRRFDHAITLCILVNTVFLAMEYHLMPDWYRKMLSIGEQLFTLVFFAEMLVKLVGLRGLRGYAVRDENAAWNRFDGFIVLSSLVDWALTLLAVSNIGVNLNLLRSFRLLRIVRIIRSNKELYRVLTAVLSSIRGMVSLLVFMLLVVVVFAILGMQLYGGKLQWEETADAPLLRASFDTFPDAVLTLFLIFSGGGPWDIYFSALRSSAGWSAPVFFILFQIFTFYVTLNFLVVILLRSFAPSYKELVESRARHERALRSRVSQQRTRAALAEAEAREAEAQRHRLRLTSSPSPVQRHQMATSSPSSEPGVEKRGGSLQMRRNTLSVRRLPPGYAAAGSAASGSAATVALRQIHRSRLGPPSPAHSPPPSPPSSLPAASLGPRQLSFSCPLNPTPSPITPPPLILSPPPAPCEAPALAPAPAPAAAGSIPSGADKYRPADVVAAAGPDSVEEEKGSGEEEDEWCAKVDVRDRDSGPNLDAMGDGAAYYSLFLFSPQNRARRALAWLIGLPQFEHAIIACICVSSVFLTLESPNYNSESLDLVVLIADYVFLIVFSLEFLFKVIALGFVYPAPCYLSDPWNRLDITVLIITILGMAGGGGGAGRTLRVGRILRPLRMINRNQAMRVIINALLQSLTQIFYTICLIMCFFFICGILGVNLFAGLFFFCNDDTVLDRDGCVGWFVSGTDGTALPRVWANPPYNFDNIFAALATLFEVVTLKGWTPVLYSAMDVTEVDQQPARNASPANALFFVLFIFIAAFYLFKVFVGIIVAHFRKFSGTALMTDSQLAWLGTKRLIQATEPELRRPEGWRGKAFGIVTHPRFEPCVGAVIVSHLMLMATESSGESQAWRDVLAGVHWGVAGLYFVEMMLKLSAFGPAFLKHGWSWNGVELLAVLLMLLMPLPGIRAGGSALIRMLRFERFVDMLDRVKGLRKLFDVLRDSFAAIVNITALFFLVVFVYAVLGMELFGRVRRGRHLTFAQNFDTFPHALLTLFQVASGENWLQIQRICEVEVPECTAQEPGGSATDCGNPTAARAFFYTYFIFVFCIFLNLYVAAILDTYASKKSDDSQDHAQGKKESGALAPQVLAKYRSVWSTLDPSASGRLRVDQLWDFCQALGPPLAMDPKADAARFKEVMAHVSMIATRRGAAWTDLATGHHRTVSKKDAPNGAMSGAAMGADEGGGGDLDNYVTFGELLKFLTLQQAPREGLQVDELASLEDTHSAVKQLLSATVLQRIVRRFLVHRRQLASEGGTVYGPSHESLPPSVGRIEVDTKSCVSGGGGGISFSRPFSSGF